MVDGTPLKAVEVTPQAVAAADCVLILTDHPDFDYRSIVETASLVVDTRGATWGIPVPAGRVVRL
jgi:UDP-N-acetyl-D-glucosamine dehydrogenase